MQIHEPFPDASTTSATAATTANANATASATTTANATTTNNATTGPAQAATTRPEHDDPIVVVRAEPFEARLAAGLTVGASRLLVIGLPAGALVAGLFGAEAGGGVARLLLGLTMLAATAGTVGALLGRFPRLPFPLAWTALVVGHGVAEGQHDPLAVLTRSLHAVGFHGALVLAGVVMTTFSLARDHHRVADVARFAPAVLGLVVVQAVITAVRGGASGPGGLSGVGVLASVVFVLGMVARLRADHRTVLDIRDVAGPRSGAEVVLLALVVTACASVLLVPTPLAFATPPFALLGGALGEASAARRAFRKKTGGRRTRNTLSQTDARYLAIWTTMLGLTAAMFGITLH